MCCSDRLQMGGGVEDRFRGLWLGCVRPISLLNLLAGCLELTLGYGVCCSDSSLYSVFFLLGTFSTATAVVGALGVHLVLKPSNSAVREGVSFLMISATLSAGLGLTYAALATVLAGEYAPYTDWVERAAEAPQNFRWHEVVKIHDLMYVVAGMAFLQVLDAHASMSAIYMARIERSRSPWATEMKDAKKPGAAAQIEVNVLLHKVGDRSLEHSTKQLQAFYKPKAFTATVDRSQTIGGLLATLRSGEPSLRPEGKDGSKPLTTLCSELLDWQKDCIIGLIMSSMIVEKGLAPKFRASPRHADWVGWYRNNYAHYSQPISDAMLAANPPFEAELCEMFDDIHRLLQTTVATLRQPASRSSRLPDDGDFGDTRECQTLCLCAQDVMRRIMRRTLPRKVTCYQQSLSGPQAGMYMLVMQGAADLDGPPRNQILALEDKLPLEHPRAAAYLEAKFPLAVSRSCVVCSNTGELWVRAGKAWAPHVNAWALDTQRRELATLAADMQVSFRSGWCTCRGF